MYKGKAVQEQDIEEIQSERRNPILADLFHRMRYMERRGSGLTKIVNETKNLPGYSETLKPQFYSDTFFCVVIKNVNYDAHLVTDQVSDQVADQVSDKNIPQKILQFCVQEKSKKEICRHLGYSNLTYFSRKYLSPLLKSGQLELTLPDKPKSQNQKYRTTM